MSEYNEDVLSDNKPMSLEEYKKYKKLFEKCYKLPLDEEEDTEYNEFV